MATLVGKWRWSSKRGEPKESNEPRDHAILSMVLVRIKPQLYLQRNACGAAACA
jgi:hypothetical protein